MTDIVERLRGHIGDGPVPSLSEAADEIERLRELRAIDLELREADRDEIERLTVALEIIAGRRQCLDNLMGNVDVACAALDGGKP